MNSDLTKFIVLDKSGCKDTLFSVLLPNPQKSAKFKIKINYLLLKYYIAIYNTLNIRTKKIHQNPWQISLFRCIFVAQNFKDMKKKNEENLPEQGCDTKMSAENGTTKEVVETETVKEENAEEKPEEEDPVEIEEDGESMEFHASRKDFLLFLQKLLHMMRDIVLLEKSLHEFEKDPIFDMLLDLSMVHLQEMKESAKDKKPSDEDSDDDEDNNDDRKENCDDDNDTVTETFFSMKVRKLKN